MADDKQRKAASELGGSDYAGHLWRRRLWIAGLTLAAFLGTWMGLRVFHANQYESRALVMVRQQPRMSNMEDDQPGIQPPVFRSLFTADDMVEYVRRQYNEIVRTRQSFAAEFPEDHEEIKSPLEKLRTRFRTQAATTVDTTIATQFSPVIELSVRGATPGQSLALMNLWVEHIMERYGNLLNEEAQFLIDSSRTRTGEIAREVAGLTERKRALENEERLVETRIMSVLRQLTNAPLPTLQDPIGNEIIGYNMYSGPRQAVLTIEEQAGPLEPGLWERRMKLEIELARLQADPELEEIADKHIELARLRAENEKVNALIPQLEERLGGLNGEAAGVRAQLAEVSVELNRLEYAVRLNSTVGSQSEALLRAVSEGEPDAKYSTLRVLSRPQVPMERVWPKRTLIAGIAAAGVLILLILMFCAEIYLRHAVDEKEGRT